jgi:hypothetical protein
MALGFLRIAAFGMLIPVLGGLAFAVISLVSGSIERNPTAYDFAISGISLGGFLMAMMTNLGVLWLDGHLTGQWTQSASGPLNPGRLISLAPLGCVACYGFVAVVLWVVAGLANGFEGFAWPLLWGLLGAGAGFLYQHLHKTLPP